MAKKVVPLYNYLTPDEQRQFNRTVERNRRNYANLPIMIARREFYALENIVRPQIYEDRDFLRLLLIRAKLRRAADKREQRETYAPPHKFLD